MRTKFTAVFSVLALMPFALLANNGLQGLETLFHIIMGYGLFVLLLWLGGWLVLFKGGRIVRIVFTVIHILLFGFNFFLSEFISDFFEFNLGIFILIPQCILVLFLIFSFQSKHEKS
ncbi:hypothetical protein KFE98_10645 [bacterium SCSIO 12741]|nr:hypothetical protein KFE98_10645 [bacterium SCSIO 12741]